MTICTNTQIENIVFSSFSNNGRDCDFGMTTTTVAQSVAIINASLGTNQSIQRVRVVLNVELFEFAASFCEQNTVCVMRKANA